MGATLSYLGYASNQQFSIRSHQHPPQQLTQCCKPTLFIANRDAAVPSATELCTHLVALENDLQSSRADNIFKDAVIQYLLQHTISNSGFKEFTVQLKAQFLALEATIDGINKDNEELKNRLWKVEQCITAPSTPSIPDSGSQSTSFSTYSNHPARIGPITGDLIDLFGCSPGSNTAKLMEEGSTPLDEFYEDESDIDEISQRTTPNLAPHQLPDLEHETPLYLFHFVNSEKDRNNIPGLPEKSNDSSTESSFSASGPGSTATSFSSTSGGTSLLDDVHSKLFNEGFSQLKALESEDDNLEKSMAIVNTLADSLSSLGRCGPISEAQDPQRLSRGIFIKPRWSAEKIFDSAQDREKAILFQYGARRTSYPDFFKYGIRYVPKVYEQDIYRTVAISGLSPSVTMKSLLEKVRGGMLVDAKLLDTAKITRSNTALVTFLYERSATAYEDHARQHPVVFNNSVARIAVVSTPTWPMLFDLRSDILKSGLTRCLEVHNVPRNTSLAALKQELTSSPVMKSNSLEYVRLGADRILGLRFTSIRAAVQSSALFSKTLRYRGCTVKYAPDPCAQPLGTLCQGHTYTSSEAIEAKSSKPSNNSDGKTGADEDLGRLTKVDWNAEAESRHGRGFGDHTETATDALDDRASHSPSPSSVSTKEPLRQETTASMASFAQSFFLAE